LMDAARWMPLGCCCLCGARDAASWGSWMSYWELLDELVQRDGCGGMDAVGLLLSLPLLDGWMDATGLLSVQLDGCGERDAAGLLLLVPLLDGVMDATGLWLLTFDWLRRNIVRDESGLVVAPDGWSCRLLGT
jgi:hypothetical protein